MRLAKPAERPNGRRGQCREAMSRIAAKPEAAPGV
jgi:hypothetical protein